MTQEQVNDVQTAADDCESNIKELFDRFTTETEELADQYQEDTSETISNFAEDCENELKTQIEDVAEETISQVTDGVMSEMEETKTVMNDGLSVTSELEPLVQDVVIAGNVLVTASDMVEEQMA